MSQQLIVKSGNGHLFHALSLLGRGAYGTVYRAKPTDGGDEIALKEIKKSSRRSADEDLSEVEVLEKIQHTNVVKFLDVFDDDVGLYIATELVPNGTLEGLLLRRGVLIEMEAKFFWHGLLAALEYLAGLKIVHGDLKPANVLLGENLKPVICDFGFAVCLLKKSTVTARGGTPYYMAPETLGNGTCSLAADVFSLAAIMYRCLQGGPPARPHGEPMRTQKEIHDHLTLKPIKMPPMTPIGRKLLEQMLRVEPRHRLSAAEASGHDYFTSEPTPRELPLHCLRTPLEIVTPEPNIAAPSIVEKGLACYVLKNIKGLGPEKQEAWELLNEALEEQGSVFSNLQMRKIWRNRNGAKTIMFAAVVTPSFPTPIRITCCKFPNLILDKFNGTYESKSTSRPATRRPSTAAVQDESSDRVLVCSECKSSVESVCCESCDNKKLCVGCAFQHGELGHELEELSVVAERRKIREDAQKMRQELDEETNEKKVLFERLLCQEEATRNRFEKLAETEKKKMPLLLLKEGRKRMGEVATTEIGRSKALRVEMQKFLDINE